MTAARMQPPLGVDVIPGERRPPQARPAALRVSPTGSRADHRGDGKARRHDIRRPGSDLLEERAAHGRPEHPSETGRRLGDAERPALRLRRRSARDQARHGGLRKSVAAGESERAPVDARPRRASTGDRKSTRLNSSHLVISYAVFCLKKKKTSNRITTVARSDPISQSTD